MDAIRLLRGVKGGWRRWSGIHDFETITLGSGNFAFTISAE